MKMHKQTYKALVDSVWDDQLDSNEREDIVKSITGYGSHFDMHNYSKEMRENIRKEMVTLRHVLSLEAIRAR